MEESKAVLKAQVLRGQHEWVIEAFSLQNATTGARLARPVFELVGSKWRLAIYPGGYSDEFAGRVGLYLRNKGVQAVAVQWAFEVLDSEGKVLQTGKCQQEQNRLFQPGRSHGKPRFLVRADVLDPSKRFLHNDTLRLRVRLERVVNSKQAVSRPKQQGQGTFAKDIAKLLDSGDCRYLVIWVCLVVSFDLLSSTAM